MADIKSKNENGVLTIYPIGRIDSSNAADFETKLNEVLEQNGDSTSIVLDIDDLEFISSVGLRIVLRLKKKFNDLKIINASADVYDVFDMTGFTEMIDIQKAYRRLSVEGCEEIGQGSNGVVYRLDPDTIIKVYRNPDSLPDIHRERELARKAFVLGIPTAIPYDVVKVGGSYGSVFELLNATSFSKLLSKNMGDFDKIVNEFVKLLKQIHSTEIAPGEMPEIKKVAIKWVNDLEPHLPTEQYEKLLSLVNAVPEKNTLIHGDYHYKNVMVQNGEVLLIDMDTLSVGHPVFEFASIFLANVGFGELNPENTLEFLGVPYEVANKIWDDTLRLYFETDDPQKLNEYSEKSQVVAYTRLLRRTIRREPENVELIEHCKKRLSHLLNSVSSLDFWQ